MTDDTKDEEGRARDIARQRCLARAQRMMRVINRIAEVLAEEDPEQEICITASLVDHGDQSGVISKAVTYNMGSLQKRVSYLEDTGKNWHFARLPASVSALVGTSIGNGLLMCDDSPIRPLISGILDAANEDGSIVSLCAIDAGDETTYAREPVVDDLVDFN